MTGAGRGGIPSRLAGHGAVWLAAGAVFLVVPHRLTRALALDYEALFANLAEGYPARLDSGAIAVGMGWIELGAAPLALLLFASLIYRITRRLGLDNPLSGAGWLPRTGMFALALGTWAVFAMPASHALAMWAQVEAYPWIQWADHVPVVMDDLRTRAPGVVLPALIVLGAALALFALRRPGQPSGGGEPSPRRWIGRAAWSCVVLGVALSSAPAWGIFVLHGSRIGTARGLGVFEDTCGQCHLRSRPLFFVKTPAEWRTTVDRMRTFEGAPIDEDQGEAVGDFLCGMRSYSDAWTTRTRCQRCHRGGSRGWEDRPEEDWDRVVDRMARWSPHYYGEPVRRQIVDHLVRTRGDEDATLGLSGEEYRAYTDLDRACSTCHSLGRAAERAAALTPESRWELLLRMADKRDPPWSSAELEALDQAYEALLADPALRERLLPHDLPATEGDLPW